MTVMLKGNILKVYACLIQAQQILDFNVNSIEKGKLVLVHFEKDIVYIKKFLDNALEINISKGGLSNENYSRQ